MRRPRVQPFSKAISHHGGAFPDSSARGRLESDSLRMQVHRSRAIAYCGIALFRTEFKPLGKKPDLE